MGKGKSGRRILSRNAKGPADIRLDGRTNFEGAYLFDDGTIGRITDVDFDLEEYLDEMDLEQDDVLMNGKEPIGQMYIDRWKPGVWFPGGCYLYYTETLADYCMRNGEPLPMKKVPDEVYDIIEEEDWQRLMAYWDEVPELRAIMKPMMG